MGAVHKRHSLNGTHMPISTEIETAVASAMMWPLQSRELQKPSSKVFLPSTGPGLQNEGHVTTTYQNDLTISFGLKEFPLFF